MLDQYKIYLDELLTLSNEIEQFFDSELEFDPKMDHIMSLLSKRDDLIQLLTKEKVDKTDEHQTLLRKIYDKDQLIIEKMNLFLHDSKSKTTEVKNEKIQISRKRMANKRYLVQNKETSGYFINNKR